MFVVSIRAGKKQILTALCAVGILLAVCVAAFSDGGAVETVSEIRVTAGNVAERIAFLRQFGWETESEPEEICEIIVPEEFNEVYARYNELQKSQGFDLSPYAGKRIKRWTYAVENYPGYDGGVVANLLILDGRVIGGDVSAVEQNGFVRGFAPDSGTTEESRAPAESTAAPSESQVSAAPENAVSA